MRLSEDFTQQPFRYTTCSWAQPTEASATSHATVSRMGSTEKLGRLDGDFKVPAVWRRSIPNAAGVSFAVGAMTTVLFACVHNAGRSQMAAAFFNRLADPASARA